MRSILAILLALVGCGRTGHYREYPALQAYADRHGIATDREHWQEDVERHAHSSGVVLMPKELREMREWRVK